MFFKYSLCRSPVEVGPWILSIQERKIVSRKKDSIQKGIDKIMRKYINQGEADQKSGRAVIGT